MKQLYIEQYINDKWVHLSTQAFSGDSTPEQCFRTIEEIGDRMCLNKTIRLSSDPEHPTIVVSQSQGPVRLTLKYERRVGGK